MLLTRLFRILPLVIIASVSAPVAAQGDDEVFLSDVLQDMDASITQGWGKTGINTAAVPTDGRAPGQLRLGEMVYDKGIGHHAPGEIVVALPEGGFDSFSALAGVHWQGGGRGSVMFQVFVDGEKRFDSEKMTDSDAPKRIDVSLKDAAELRLVATDAGDGIGCDMANWAEAKLLRDPNAMRFGKPSVSLGGSEAPEPTAEVCGLSLIAGDSGPQAAAMGRTALAACVATGEEIALEIPVTNGGAFVVEADAVLRHGAGAHVTLKTDSGRISDLVLREARGRLRTRHEGNSKNAVIRFAVKGLEDESLVRLENVRLVKEDDAVELRIAPRPPRETPLPPRSLPALRPAMEELLIEWDWRMQDGIGTPREAVTRAVAIERLVTRARALLADLKARGVNVKQHADALEVVEAEFARLFGQGIPDTDTRWEDLWLRAHRLRRRIVFANPLADVGPLLFAKRVPAAFSHQLTQYYGRNARAGGGLFVLDSPGKSMACREVVGTELPPGSFMQPEVSYDATRILFAYCEVPWTPTRARREECFDRHYHLYEVRPDGTALRQLTDGPYDDFSPRELPNGTLMFISTRRGGFHRCGRGPCNVYTLAIAESDGSNPQTVSYHETQEWDPAVLADGRVIYTRWDYVDRNAVHYQQLWSVRQDGSAPAIYYGNNTFNPVGVWEPRQVPGSPHIMATAAAHHAMTAGSIILLDTTQGVDGLGPITRLTPDAPFPESETYVAPRNWHAPGSPKEYDTPEEARRWPGHCYRSPYPLSEKYFLAAYSFDALIGEPDPNKPNMFGLYFVDAFGNKELLYRDLSIASQWPTPVRSRRKPPALPVVRDGKSAKEGTFFLQDVYASDPSLPKDSVKALRIVQVLPKTTPHANQPRVGFANASPGKQVLGTVPVEPDGSAFFTAPARIPLCFQALDEHGRAVQIMRSITYLQPGEQSSCVGCHEHRLTAPPPASTAMAFQGGPDRIKPGPDGSNPLSYPLLVQPVLDKHCVKCHGGEKPAGPKECPIVLTGDPEGAYSKSYNILAKRVPFSSWGGLESNGEPLTQPGRFGSRASELMEMLLDGHHDVELNENERERLVTWMDANALFYGTFDPEDQARQLRGERIEGPALE